MSDRPAVTEADLNAYVDGHPPDRRAEQVEAYLREHPEEAGRIRVYGELNAALREAYRNVLSEPVPDRLRQFRHRNLTARLARAAAVAGIFLLGGLAGWYGRGVLPKTAGLGTPPMVQQAIAAHAVYAPEVKHPVEVGANHEAHLVAWLSKRLGAKVRAPDLTGLGYHLVGGRLLPDQGKPAAQFMYQNGTGTRLTLYVRNLAGQSSTAAFRYKREDGVSAFYWVDRKLGYVLIGPMDRSALLDVAHQVYQQLSG